MHERSSRFYCERCSDTGMVSVDRIGAQPEALRCGCYRVNPVIQARHDRFGRKKKPKGGGGMGPYSQISLPRVEGRTKPPIYRVA